MISVFETFVCLCLCCCGCVFGVFRLGLGCFCGLFWCLGLFLWFVGVVWLDSGGGFGVDLD